MRDTIVFVVCGEFFEGPCCVTAYFNNNYKHCLVSEGGQEEAKMHFRQGKNWLMVIVAFFGASSGTLTIS